MTHPPLRIFLVRRRRPMPAGWLWLAAGALSWSLVIAAGYGLMALAADIAGRDGLVAVLVLHRMVR
jgi:hypothetical protein